VNAPQVDGAVALHRAIYKDDLELADMLLRAGSNRMWRIAKALHRSTWPACTDLSPRVNTAAVEAAARAIERVKERLSK